MKRVLIAYYSRTGTTEKMAQFIAEGVRMAGHEAVVKSVPDIRSEKEIAGYDAYILGCPTYHLDMPKPFQTFLDMVGRAGLGGKVGGAFSSRSHPSSTEGDSPAERIFEILESQLKMTMTSLGPFDLKTGLFGDTEDLRACQDYGKAIGEMLGN